MMSVRFFSCKLLSCRFFFFFNCRDCFHSWNFICFPTVFGKQMKVHFIWTVEHISVCQATTRKTKKIKRKEKKSSSWMIWLFNIWYYWFCLPLAPPPSILDKHCLTWKDLAPRSSATPDPNHRRLWALWGQGCGPTCPWLCKAHPGQGLRSRGPFSRCLLN